MKQIAFFSRIMTGFALVLSPLKADGTVVPNAPNMQPMSQEEARAHCAEEVLKYCNDPAKAQYCTDKNELNDKCIAAMTDPNIEQKARRESIWQFNEEPTP